MLCGADGTPLSDMELWSYTGAAALCKTLHKTAGYAESYYKTTGSLVNSTYPYFKLMQKRDDDALPAGCRIGGQGVYNMYRLTDAWVTTLSMASGTGLLNIATRDFDDGLLKSIGVEKSQLPEIVNYEKTFPLSEAGAELLGQKAGTPVVPAYPDGALNQIGAGALSHGVMSFSVGTSAAIRMTTKDALLPKTPSLWSYFALSSHLLGAATSGACNCQDWFKANFFPQETAYAELEKRLDETRSTPIFLPFLFGERCPGWNETRSGGFTHLKPEHTVFSMYQAVLEGVLFNVYQCYEILIKTAGEPRVIKLSGGILHSSFWTQMCADIFGKEMHVDANEQSSLMGAAVIGMHLLGAISSPEAFDPEPAKIVKPDTNAHARYMEKYKRYLDDYSHS